MNKDLTVLKVKTTDAKPFPLDDELHPNLPRHPFLMMTSSAPRSGKTMMLLNLVANSNYYNIRDRDDNPYFDRIIWCSPSADFDKNVKQTLEKLDNVHVIHDPRDLANIKTIINTVIADQTKLHEEKKPMERIAIFLDDCIGWLTEDVARMSSRYRHFGCTMVISIQKYSKAPLLLRTCLGHFVTFKQNNGKERERIGDELAEGFVAPDEFEDILNTVTEQKYQFLYMNMENMCLYKNFDTLLIDCS